MKYLIDTNIISELTKAKQNIKVIDWFNSVQDQNLFLSVLTIGELRKGISKINDTEKSKKIREWLDEELTIWFTDRILPIDLQVANKWGLIQSESNRTLPAIDSLIMATALHFDLTLVTRNVKDFSHPSLEIINPFEL
jgi:predicted nucleic acid-binding protein